MGVGYDVIRLAPSAAAHVDAYLEYHRIVGDDGGPLLSGEGARAPERRRAHGPDCEEAAEGTAARSGGPSPARLCKKPPTPARVRPAL